jgi:hypothetical protein
MSTIPAHVQRMIREFTELTDRTELLGNFMNENPVFQTLPPTEQSLMQAQGHAMMAYANILELRIELTGYMIEPVHNVIPLPLELDEAMEVGGSDIDVDGPPKFD